MKACSDFTVEDPSFLVHHEEGLVLEDCLGGPRDAESGCKATQRHF